MKIRVNKLQIQFYMMAFILAIFFEKVIIFQIKMQPMCSTVVEVVRSRKI